MNFSSTFAITFLILVSASLLANAQSTQITERWKSKEARQFDFWIGEWSVNLREIQKDLSWKDTTEAKVEIYPILDGKAILELWDSEVIKGFSLRYFDTDQKKWVLYLNWPDENVSGFSSLTGTFRHGRGEFFAKHDNTISRFTFCDISPTSLRWDDAYSKDGGKTWTYDWIMEFSRTAPIPQWPTDSTALTFSIPGTRCRGNKSEFEQIASIAGQWKGEVEFLNNGQSVKAPATAKAFRILDGCATIQFVEFTHKDQAIRAFSMLTYNSKKKQFEELFLDNGKASSAVVLSGAFGNGGLKMESEGNRRVRAKWLFPVGEQPILEIQRAIGGSEILQTFKLTKVEEKFADQAKDSMKLSDSINEFCPRSGKPVVATSLTTYRGYTVGFCNIHCRDDFAGNVDRCVEDRKFFDSIIDRRDKDR